MSHHAGLLTISGTAPDDLVTTRNVAPRQTSYASHSRERHGRPSTTRDEAILALTTLGWKRGLAITAVDAAMGHVGHGEPVERVIREALRRCPVPVVA